MSSPWQSRKIWGATGMSLVFLVTLFCSFRWNVPADVLSNLAFGVAGAWTAQTGTQGWEDARRASATTAKPNG